MIYVYHGDDDFSASEALGRLMEAVGPEDMREANVAQLDARGFTVDKFGGAAMVAPFMAERRVVVVRGLLASLDSQRTARRGRRGAGGEADTLASSLALLLTALPPSTDAVFLESRVAAGNPLLAAIKEMVPLFPETQQYLKKVEVDDRSGPKLDAVTPDKSAPGPQEIMQLVPLFAETKQYLKKVETVDKSKPAIPAGAGAVSDAHKGKAGSLGERAPPIKPRASKQEKTLSIAERRKQLVALRQTVEATQFDM